MVQTDWSYTWRQVVVLRAYAKYLRQAGTFYSQEYMESTLLAYPGIAALLVALFETRFDPALRLAHEDRMLQSKELIAALNKQLDNVHSLDQDRIVRSYLTLITSTLRTSFFQRDQGRPKSYVAFKLDPQSIPELPAPRPKFEIFVYSPRFEGVHLRFGSVARGGLRWSDRREDFRTEILGLVKAQMVKNAVIVPTVAKGGFVLKKKPGDRDEAVACYKLFITALLDVTDNLVDGAVVPPPEVVRHDPDDPYLVVAADKGTATFSDTANEISVRKGFWMRDAFASGGSAGYDHKGMGITARGAWELVKKRFRDLGVDTQSQEFTVVGVGDMSGDVFGNGMLLSEHIRLVAAFDHRHIFIDPTPDAAASYAVSPRSFSISVLRSSSRAVVSPARVHSWKRPDSSQMAWRAWRSSAVLRSLPGFSGLGSSETRRPSARSSRAASSSSAAPSSDVEPSSTSSAARSAGNMPPSSISSSRRSKPREKPHAGTSRPRNRPIRLS